MNMIRLYYSFCFVVVIFVIFVGVLIFSPPAESKEYLYTGAWSKHISNKKDYNESHHLIAYQKDSYMIGTFTNSYDDESYILSKKFTFGNKYNLEFGLHTAGVYGYYSCSGGGKRYKNRDPRKLCLTLIPELAYTKYKWQPTILILGNASAFALRREF